MANMIQSASLLVEELAKTQEPVLISMGMGKDSFVMALHLRDMGVNFELFGYYNIPPLDGKEPRFVQEQKDYVQKFFGKRLHWYPNPLLYDKLGDLIFQPPHRAGMLRFLNVKLELTMDDLHRVVKEDLGLPQDTWVAIGIRVADSMVRRASLRTHGTINHTRRTFYPVANFQKKHILAYFHKYGVKLPRDYILFGRSYDGLDRRFAAPIKECLPEDYEILKFWFPLIDADIWRYRYAKERRAKGRSF